VEVDDSRVWHWEVPFDRDNVEIIQHSDFTIISTGLLDEAVFCTLDYF